MQWKGSFEIVTTVGINDYRINMGGKEKTFHAHMLKGYIARDQDASQETTEEMPPTSSLAIPAASVTVIEDLEGEHFNDSDCEALPELGGWGSEETVNDLKYDDKLTLDQRRQLEEVALTYSSIFIERPGTASTEEHCIELTSSIPYFSKIDLSKGYWQIPVRKEDIPKTAFVTMDCHYEFLRMPFGMMKSGATLTCAVKKLLCGMDNVVDYIDDLLIHTETWEAHVKTLSELFKRLQ
ncbi:Zinc finger protein [Plakobranchus ocellatus]|uniref:Zinc finger protein n=1 Tax=Plakobranchus ocellatus TaxID=259542 RepID=A0AAV4C4A8_9GAST|nr:Zinc finger protein [Plakobranchus ocellatus]